MTFSELVDYIMDYESDTFSATSAELNREEARHIARQLIKTWTITHLDGDMIGEELDEIRTTDIVTELERSEI